MKDLPFIVHFANDILKSFYLCPSQDYQEYYWQQPLLDALICPVSADEDPWIPENRLINYSLIVNHKFTIFSKKNTTVEFLKTHPNSKIKCGQLIPLFWFSLNICLWLRVDNGHKCAYLYKHQPILIIIPVLESMSSSLRLFSLVTSWSPRCSWTQSWFPIGRW